MLSKETAAIFPLVLVAYEMLRERQSGPQRWGKRLVWTLPFFGVVAAYAAVRTLLFGRDFGPGPGTDRLSALWDAPRSEEHTSELQSHLNLVCRLLLEKKKNSGQHRSTANHAHS